MSPRAATSASLLLAIALSLVACGDGPEGRDGVAAAGADPGAASDPGLTDVAPPAGDPTEVLFPRDRVLEIALEMAPHDWDALRTQTRSIFDILGPGCLQGPLPSPFGWYGADVTIDGARLERIAVRKKGLLGSLDPERPSLKLKLDELVEGQALHGMTGLTLNNARQDPAKLSQCLTYDLFTAAGLAAPRCAFAHVTVNGSDLGLYVHVEALKRPLLARHFGDGGGNLYEGTLSDFREGWDATFAKKTNEKEDDWSDLAAARAALEADDAGLLAALDPVFDVDRFLTFWAVEVLVGHWDGYAGNANNFYLYRDPGDGRFRFLPWGVDATLAPREAPQGAPPPPQSVLATGVLPWRLHRLDETRARYVARLRELLATVWDEAALVAEIDRLEALVTPFVRAEARPTMAEALAIKRQWIQRRRADLEAELEPAPGPWPGPLRDAPCLTQTGSMQGSFATSWGTADVDNLFLTGSGSWELTVGDTLVPFLQIGAKAGLETEGNEAGKAILWLAGQIEAQRFALVMFVFSPDDLQPGSTLPIDPGGRVQATAVTFTAGDDPQLLGLVSQGTLTLSAAAATAGAPLEGTFTGRLLGW